MPLNHNDIACLAPRVRQAVAAAGEIILGNWERPSSIRRKGRIDLVTETDLAVESELKKSLKALLPEAAVLAEESHETLEPAELTWIIDPVDGTTNFAHRLPWVAISVALWCKGQSVLGFVHVPALGETFHAVRGGGAYLNNTPLAVSEVENLEDALIATGFPYNLQEEIEGLMDDLERVLLHTQGVRRPGSASIDLAYTAAGRFDGFYEINLKPWDTAAGWLLVEEAGGRVTQFDALKPYHLRSRSILATNGQVHESLAGLLRNG